MKPSDLLKQYVSLHNYGVETADFDPLMALFTDDIIFEFEDPRIGKFEGIELLRGVFHRQGPTASILIDDITEEGQNARARYTDEDRSDIWLGNILLEVDGDKIKRIYITR